MWVLDVPFEACWFQIDLNFEEDLTFILDKMPSTALKPEDEDAVLKAGMVSLNRQPWSWHSSHP